MWTTPPRSRYTWYLGANRQEMQKFSTATSSSAMVRLWGHHRLMSLVSGRHKSDKIDLLTSRVGGLGNMRILQAMPPSLMNFPKPHFPSFIAPCPQCSSPPFRPSAALSGIKGQTGEGAPGSPQALTGNGPTGPPRDTAAPLKPLHREWVFKTDTHDACIRWWVGPAWISVVSLRNGNAPSQLSKGANVQHVECAGPSCSPKRP